MDGPTLYVSGIFRVKLHAGCSHLAKESRECVDALVIQTAEGLQNDPTPRSRLVGTRMPGLSGVQGHRKATLYPLER